MNEVVWPMGMDRDLSTRPLMFDPRDFLVAILPDDAACEGARTALLDAGFATEVLRVYTSKQILKDREDYLAARSMTRRVIEALTDDEATTELYFGYAAEGRGALWVFAPDKRDASRAVRCLVDHDVLHFRYFGRDQEHDIHVE